MSLAMLLALRQRWLEVWLDGLDKMYRLHKWLGIGALLLSALHWLVIKGPKWAVGWGWITRPAKGGGANLSTLEAFLRSQRGLAESIGEWAFYAAVLLIALALIKRFPYRLFYQSHRLLALVYLALVAHSLVLLKFSYWTTPVGWVTAALLAVGSWPRCSHCADALAPGGGCPAALPVCITSPASVPCRWTHGSRAGRGTSPVSSPSPCLIAARAFTPTPLPPAGNRRTRRSASWSRNWGTIPALCASSCASVRRLPWKAPTAASPSMMIALDRSGWAAASASLPSSPASGIWPATRRTPARWTSSTAPPRSTKRRWPD